MAITNNGNRLNKHLSDSEHWQLEALTEILSQAALHESNRELMFQRLQRWIAISRRPELYDAQFFTLTTTKCHQQTANFFPAWHQVRPIRQYFVNLSTPSMATTTLLNVITSNELCFNPEQVSILVSELLEKSLDLTLQGETEQPGCTTQALHQSSISNAFLNLIVISLGHTGLTQCLDQMIALIAELDYYERRTLFKQTLTVGTAQLTAPQLLWRQGREELAARLYEVGAPADAEDLRVASLSYATTTAAPEKTQRVIRMMLNNMTEARVKQADLDQAIKNLRLGLPQQVAGYTQHVQKILRQDIEVGIDQQKTSGWFKQLYGKFAQTARHTPEEFAQQLQKEWFNESGEYMALIQQLVFEKISHQYRPLCGPVFRQTTEQSLLAAKQQTMAHPVHQDNLLQLCQLIRSFTAPAPGYERSDTERVAVGNIANELAQYAPPRLHSAA